MAVDDVKVQETFSGNGLVEEFTSDIYILFAEDIEAVHIDDSGDRSDLELNVDYSIEILSNPEDGFRFNFPISGSTFSTLGSNEEIVVTRDPDPTQLTVLKNQGPYLPNVVEKALDKITMILQKLDLDLDRAVTAPNDDDTIVDFKNRRGVNAVDPINNQDVATLAYVMSRITEVADGTIAVIPKDWRGTTDGSAVIDISSPQADLSDERGYLVVVDDVPVDPDDYTVDLSTPGSEILTLDTTPANGTPYWIVANGYARQLNEFPDHDHDDIYYRKHLVTQILGTYSTTTASANNFNLAITGAREAPQAYQDGMIVVWKPSDTNTSTTVTLNLNGLGTKNYRRSDDTVPPASWLDTTRWHISRFDSSNDRFIDIFPNASIGTPDDDSVSTAKIQDDAVTQAKLASGLRIPMTYISTTALSGSFSVDIDGIPSDAREVLLVLDRVSVSASGDQISMRLGHSAGTFIATGYSGAAVDTTDSSRTVWSTDAVLSENDSPPSEYNIWVHMIKASGNLWLIQANCIAPNQNTDPSMAQGVLDMSSNVLDAIQMRNLGAGTFDNGNAYLFAA